MTADQGLIQERILKLTGPEGVARLEAALEEARASWVKVEEMIPGCDVDS